MSKQFPETSEQISPRRIGVASIYSAHVQEAMRYDKLASSDYHLVMTILRAVTQGTSEEKWKEEQQRSLKTLTDLPTNKGISHADAANRYEQTVSCLKDLTLWPW